MLMNRTDFRTLMRAKGPCLQVTKHKNQLSYPSPLSNIFWGSIFFDGCFENICIEPVYIL